MSLLSASINGPQSVASESFVDIDGLKLTLPPASSKLRSALILLNVPMPYAEGSESPEIIFNIDCDGRSVARRGFGSDDGILPLMKREPFTLVVEVPLRNGAESLVHAQWAGVHGSRGRINSFASISAIVE
jgi:hypothetical protein